MSYRQDCPKCTSGNTGVVKTIARPKPTNYCADCHHSWPLSDDQATSLQAGRSTLPDASGETGA